MSALPARRLTLRNPMLVKTAALSLFRCEEEGEDNFWLRRGDEGGTKVTPALFVEKKRIARGRMRSRRTQTKQT